MIYALIEKGAVKTYPYTLPMLRRDFNVSFSEDVATAMLQAAELGAVEVAAVDRPVVDETKDVREGTPQLVNGVWTQVWSVTDADPAVVAARQKAASDDSARAAVKADNLVQQLLGKTPAELDTYVKGQISDPKTAALVSKLVQIVRVLAARELRN
jgi:hypothetical protein